MEFPCEIQTIINDYAKPASAMLRENWREGSSINAILTRDQWWEDYIFGWGCMHQDESWLESVSYTHLTLPTNREV